MNAPVRARVKDPLATVLYDLECLHEDISFLRDIEVVQKFDAEVMRFIGAIQKAQKGGNENASSV